MIKQIKCRQYSVKKLAVQYNKLAVQYNKLAVQYSMKCEGSVVLVKCTIEQFHSIV